MRTDLSWLRRPGIAAAIAMLAAAGIVGGVSIAGARENMHALLRRGRRPVLLGDEEDGVRHRRVTEHRDGDRRHHHLGLQLGGADRHAPQRPTQAGAATADATGTSSADGAGRRHQSSGSPGRASTSSSAVPTPTMTGTVTVNGDPVERHAHRHRRRPTPTADGVADVPGHGAARPDRRARQPPQHAGAGQGRAHGHAGAGPDAREGQGGLRGRPASFWVSEPATIQVRARAASARSPPRRCTSPPARARSWSAAPACARRAPTRCSGRPSTRWATRARR